MKKGNTACEEDTGIIDKGLVSIEDELKKNNLLMEELHDDPNENYEQTQHKVQKFFKDLCFPNQFHSQIFS